MHIAIVTAGGAGMFCGSCMHDNTWARALQAEGVEASLIPTYTPVRVDESDVTSGPILLGGVNVYLDHRWRWWGRLPAWTTSWLNHPRVLNWASRLGVSNDAAQLGPLTIDMLQGAAGSNRREVLQFVEYFVDHMRPDVIILSNALLSGVMPALRERFSGTVLCTLQGDDVFLDGLPEDHRRQAIELIRENCQLFDGFLCHSEFYEHYMSAYLGLQDARFDRIPLSINLEGHNGQPQLRNNDQFTIGYFARICPEKGLHHLIAAYREFRQQRSPCRLVAAGYLGDRDQSWYRQLSSEASDLGSEFQYVGSPDEREAKIEFLSELDVLCVPTDYQEPKGLYVLEALANGTPVIQPRHGAFPELLQATQGGLLYEAHNQTDLVRALCELYDEPDRRIELARTGQAQVRQRFTAKQLARSTIAACERFQRSAAIG